METLHYKNSRLKLFFSNPYIRALPNNYLDFGYSVLCQTPIKHVKFFPHSSRLIIDDKSKQITIECFDDVLEHWLERTTPEHNVLDLLKTTVVKWEKSVEGEIIIPTSGGYDSRLLNFLISDKSRIRSFTYGISKEQSSSSEVIYAKKISEILGTQWNQIKLGNYHNYFDEWDKLFGISTHAHGMYHIEFYREMRQIIQKEKLPLLSGIIGDAWSGRVKIGMINSYLDVGKLGYTHGLNADSSFSMFPQNYSMLKAYFERNQEKLKSPIVRVVEAMRFKMPLLSFILVVPKSEGFQPWSPYVLPEIALSMLTISPERRENRVWQRDFFESNGLLVESMDLHADRENYLNHQAINQVPLKLLDANLLREVVQPCYVEWINNHWSWFWNLNSLNKLSLFSGFSNSNIWSRRIKAYGAYLTLKPIENLLRKRNFTTK